MRVRGVFAAAVASMLAVVTACDPEMGSYHEALDADREARAKMATALGLMRDAAALEAEGEQPPELILAIENKRNEALDAFYMAIESWDLAEKVYRKLIADNPGELVYVNNLANLLYLKARNGLTADLEEARSMLERAVAEAENQFFSRNLELIVSLTEDPEAMRLAAENREIVAELQRLSEEKP